MVIGGDDWWWRLFNIDDYDGWWCILRGRGYLIRTLFFPGSSKTVKKNVMNVSRLIVNWFTADVVPSSTALQLKSGTFRVASIIQSWDPRCRLKIDSLKPKSTTYQLCTHWKKSNLIFQKIHQNDMIKNGNRLQNHIGGRIAGIEGRSVGSHFCSSYPMNSEKWNHGLWTQPNGRHGLPPKRMENQNRQTKR